MTLARGTLHVELVPESAWFSNLRSELVASEWDTLRRQTYRNAGHRCEVCGGRGPKHPVECHERWHYNDKTWVQTLVGTIALCPDCHQAVHFGLAELNGKAEEALAKLIAVNNWSHNEAKDHVRQAAATWERRSEVDWTLDARWLHKVLELSPETAAKLQAHLTGKMARG